jgi:hypothetical protein
MYHRFIRTCIATLWRFRVRVEILARGRCAKAAGMHIAGFASRKDVSFADANAACGGSSSQKAYTLDTPVHLPHDIVVKVRACRESVERRLTVTDLDLDSRDLLIVSGP